MGKQNYEEFVEKFKRKKTTDDCYTPVAVYEVVKEWAVKEYGLEGREIVRPFWPDTDYKTMDYPERCVVIDNPPFSILSKICKFYEEKGIDYFLFAPHLTLFNTNRGGSNYVVSNSRIIYENGANVNTSFVTSLGEYKICTRPELAGAINSAIKQERQKKTKALPKYEYPENIITAAKLGGVASRAVINIRPEEAEFTRQLERQKEIGKALFGAGFLISDRAAAEKAAAEKAAEVEKIIFQLSSREKEIVARLSR